MAELINALDNITPTQFGENGHKEYGWSNNLQEKILQFSFQLTRTIHGKNHEKLSNILCELLNTLKNKYETGILHEKQIAINYLSLLYKLIGHTRDIIDGKGEYNLSYMMIYEWNKVYPLLAQFALKCFVLLDNNAHAYGSWKDIKYFHKYCMERNILNSEYDQSNDNQIIDYAVQLMNEQIKKDYQNIVSNNTHEHISLAAKWAPREKSSFSDLYNLLATNYFSEYLTTANTPEKYKKATKKCKTEYRKILSTINKYLDTLQIKQCDKKWADINFKNVTSISLSKQKKAFLNTTKTGKPRYPDTVDRISCAENFKNYVEQTIKQNKEIKGKRIEMSDFVKQALQLLFQQDLSSVSVEINLLNSQWRDNSTQTGSLGKMIAMVDVSGSMGGDPMAVAIALGIRIAEKSILGKRVMTFSSKPTWVNLDDCDNFISAVNKIKKADWGMNTNFYAAFDMILRAIIENKMDPLEVQDMVLVILSDMQMDVADKTNKNTLYDTINTRYKEAGMAIHGIPYKPPHILFWNLRSTDGFPCLANQHNTSMMSGFSPNLLNIFCDKGLEALQSCTPWSVLLQSLDNQRYELLINKFNDAFV